MATDLTNLVEALAKSYNEFQFRTDDSKIETLYENWTNSVQKSLERIKDIGNDPSVVTSGGDEIYQQAMNVLPKLTLLLLLSALARIGPLRECEGETADNVGLSVAIVNITGWLVESLNYDERMTTKEHCVALFENVSKVMRLREQCVTKGSSTTGVDECLHKLCPPLMTYFPKHLSVLKELRDQNKDVHEAVRTKQSGIDMIREFLLQVVEETILFAWVEEATRNNDGISKPMITYAQRVKFTGLCNNCEMVQWAKSDSAITGLDPKFAQTGALLEMSSWTGLFDTEEGIFPFDLLHQLKIPHRIYQAGVPDDIPTLDGERIVLCYVGCFSRHYEGKVFPLIELEASKVGGALTDAELNELQLKIQGATNEEVEHALKHTMHRASDDELIQKAVRRLSMVSLSVDPSK